MDLFNSPIKEVFFDVNSNENINTISKSLVDEGKTEVYLNILSDNKTLKFKLKNTRKLDRKSLNLLRKREILSVIN